MPRSRRPFLRHPTLAGRPKTNRDRKFQIRGNSMSYHVIKSKLAGKDGTKALTVPFVIDIRGASQQSGAALQTWPQKATGNKNQQWQFTNSPVSGYYSITSQLDNSFVSCGAQAGAAVTASSLVPDAPNLTLWRFLQDPAGSGYCFIQSLLNGYVLDVKGDSQQEGASLVTQPIKSSGNDNQLWKASFPSVVGLSTTMTWNNLGTGSGTTGSDAAECAYSLNLQISQDGICRFWGSYTNRGDTFASTAPPQDFGVAIVVQDLQGNGYAFCYGGFAWSAPQPGSTIAWDYTGPSAVITDNWASIALRNQANFHFSNQATEGVGVDGRAAPPDTINTIFGLMQDAVSGAGGGSIGTVFSATRDTIFVGYGDIPTTAVQSGPQPGSAGGSKPPNWSPTGNRGAPAR